MGGNSSKSSSDPGNESLDPKAKKGSLLNCTCGKGRDDKDEVQAEGPGKNGTRLTEEEWAAVRRTGKLGTGKSGPDLLSEEMDQASTRGQHRKRISRGNGASDADMDAGPFPSNGQVGMMNSPQAREVGNPVQGFHPSPASGQALNGHRGIGERRFKIGDRVRCACSRWGNEWEAGNVVKLDYREADWPPGQPSAPYQVKLDKGALIYAPEDSDEFIQFQDESWAKELPP
eukprot:CAMPEP_0181294590 /NCGR_PEP_ID=MMETSP1101-20121128/3689_1 /TAXON_ID=46948 /ORGANISM="Rhodomonas abbreviata, Strain Caron Lab Isolate" /LENGTH=229 /DNA_ID=CAMNT_0023399273 /DNA_START=198 /DNA_END=883 /DNA_ORIENTATION=-